MNCALAAGYGCAREYILNELTRVNDNAVIQARRSDEKLTDEANNFGLTLAITPLSLYDNL